MYLQLLFTDYSLEVYLYKSSVETRKSSSMYKADCHIAWRLYDSRNALLVRTSTSSQYKFALRFPRRLQTFPQFTKFIVYIYCVQAALSCSDEQYNKVSSARDKIAC